MKLVKVVAVEITLVKHMVLVVEKVVVKERPQILVVAHNMELVLEEARWRQQQEANRNNSYGGSAVLASDVRQHEEMLGGAGDAGRQILRNRG